MPSQSSLKLGKRDEQRQDDSVESLPMPNAAGEIQPCLPRAPKKRRTTSQNAPNQQRMTETSLPGPSSAMRKRKCVGGNENIAMPGTSRAMPGTSRAIPGTSRAIPGTNMAMWMSVEKGNQSVSMPGTSRAMTMSVVEKNGSAIRGKRKQKPEAHAPTVPVPGKKKNFIDRFGQMSLEDFAKRFTGLCLSDASSDDSD